MAVGVSIVKLRARFGLASAHARERGERVEAFCKPVPLSSEQRLVTAADCMVGARAQVTMGHEALE